MFWNASYQAAEAPKSPIRLKTPHVLAGFRFGHYLEPFMGGRAADSDSGNFFLNLATGRVSGFRFICRVFPEKKLLPDFNKAQRIHWSCPTPCCPSFLMLPSLRDREAYAQKVYGSACAYASKVGLGIQTCSRCQQPFAWTARRPAFGKCCPQ